MANQQNTTGGLHNHRMAGQQGAMGSAEQATGVHDKSYDVISVLYHALQAGETTMQYLQDAERSSDQELVQFFQEVQECQRHLAMRAKEMLMRRMGQGATHGQHTQAHAMPGAQGSSGAREQGQRGQDMHRAEDTAMAGAGHRAQDREQHNRGNER
jgi:hypothetical protein